MYTIKEEIANAITHGLGVLLSIPAIVFLVIFAIRYGSPVDVVSFSIFGASMLFLYLSS
ncbi:hemolysin III family protein, partial [Bacillus licheniformis]